MNGKTFLLTALVAAYGLGFAGAASAADAQSASRSEAAQQDLSAQTEAVRGSGHMAPNQDRAAVARAADRSQAIPGDRHSLAQAPERALNQEIYYPPYTY